MSLNQFVKFIDLDGVMSADKSPTLKTIFDNLRNYLILALFYLVAREMVTLQLSYLHYVLMGFLLIFTVATFIQTALLLTYLIMEFTVYLFPKQFFQKNESVKYLFALILVFLFFLCLLLALAMFSVLSELKIS